MSWNCPALQMSVCCFRDIANAIKNLLDAVNSVFVYVNGQSHKQVGLNSTHVQIENILLPQIQGSFCVCAQSMRDDVTL